MNKQRPVFLNLMQIKFPPMAIASILHRISGVAIFLSLPILLWMLHLSLSTKADFEHLAALLNQPSMKFGLWLVMLAAFFHLLAGIRHMIMDLGYAESLKAGRAGAYTVIVLAIISSIVAGVWLW